MENRKILLSEDEMPRQWYNILADIAMNPPLGPDGKPISPDMLAPVFPMNLIEQEVSQERWIDIPEEILGILKIWRPSPWCGPGLWKRLWVRRPAFILKMKA
jgi:tryptophan synthase beta chain